LFEIASLKGLILVPCDRADFNSESVCRVLHVIILSKDFNREWGVPKLFCDIEIIPATRSAVC
jgi:hypothetical protein